MAVRQIVRIDEELCNGCGACVTPPAGFFLKRRHADGAPCAEGAIELVDGKARVVREELCDGAGFCLGVCPTGALSIEVREAVPFDERAAEVEESRRGGAYIEQVCHVCGQGEDSRVLIPCRKAGESLWVCTRCLPSLIHG